MIIRKYEDMSDFKENAPKFLQEYSSGFTCSFRFSAIEETEDFALIKHFGHTSYISCLKMSTICRTDWRIIRKGSQMVYMATDLDVIHTGRASEAKISEMISDLHSKQEINNLF